MRRLKIELRRKKVYPHSSLEHNSRTPDNHWYS